MANRLEITVERQGLPPLKATTTTYMCTADRVSFERQFETNSGVLYGMAAAFNAETGVVDASAAGGVREEWILYFVFRALGRELGDAVPPDFETFVAQVLDVTMESKEMEENPTTPPGP